MIIDVLAHRINFIALIVTIKCVIIGDKYLKKEKKKVYKAAGKPDKLKLVEIIQR